MTTKTMDVESHVDYKAIDDDLRAKQKLIVINTRDRVKQFLWAWNYMGNIITMMDLLNGLQDLFLFWIFFLGITE